MEFFAGVDTHRDNHTVAVINAVGEVLKTFTIEANEAGYESAIEQVADFDGLVWGVEGTGSYGLSFAKALASKGHTVYEVPGTITKRHRRRLRRVGKSDPQDAQAIAEAVLRERATLPQYAVRDSEEATRLLYGRRDRAVRERTAKVNRIRALALRLELDLAEDLTSGRALENLAALLAKTTTVGYADFEALDEIRELTADLQRLQLRIADLEQRMRPFVNELAPELLEIRGCSIISAAGLIGNIGSTQSYPNADAFAAHAGAAPMQCSSGQYDSVRLRTGGNRQLNRCLHNIANVQMRTPGHLGQSYYVRKRAEGKTHREAMRCLKRRLAAVVFRTLKAAEGRRSTPAYAFAA